MHRTQFTVKDGDELLDQGDFTNCPDLADQRIQRCLKYHPNATITRVDDPNWYEGKQQTPIK